MLGGHAPVAGHESVKGGVERVHVVDGPPGAVPGAVGVVRRSGKLPQSGRVRAGPVRGHDCAVLNPAAQAGERALGGEGAAAGHVEEGLAGVVHAGHDADLLLGEAALAALPAAMVRPPRKLEGTPPVVALEGLGEVGLVQLAAAALRDREGADERRDDLKEPPAHEEARGQGYADPLRARAQAQAVSEALDVGHPLLGGELAHADHATGADPEGPAAPVAEVALAAVLRMALPDYLNAAAPRAALDLVAGALALRLVHRVEHDRAKALDGALALGAAHARKLLPDRACEVLCHFMPPSF